MGSGGYHTNANALVINIIDYGTTYNTLRSHAVHLGVPKLAHPVIPLRLNTTTIALGHRRVVQYQDGCPGRRAAVPVRGCLIAGDHRVTRGATLVPTAAAVHSAWVVDTTVAAQIRPL